MYLRRAFMSDYCILQFTRGALDQPSCSLGAAMPHHPNHWFSVRYDLHTFWWQLSPKLQMKYMFRFLSSKPSGGNSCQSCMALAVLLHIHGRGFLGYHHLNLHNLRLALAAVFVFTYLAVVSRLQWPYLRRVHHV